MASGKNLQPYLIYGRPKPLGPDLPFTPEQLRVAHEGMFDVVNGRGTGVGSKIDIGGVKMAGKTGTAQVRALVARGHVGDWKSRDHALFVCYAPADNPRYAMAVVVEHGTFGARAAAPIAKDVMTFLFDPPTAIARLHELEKAWGGKPTERLRTKYNAFVAKFGTSAPKVGDDEAVKTAIEKVEAPQPDPQSAANPPAITRPEEPASVPAEPPATPSAAPVANPAAGTP